jgi:hypothetical protein
MIGRTAELIVDKLSEWRDERRRKRYIAEHEQAKAKADAGNLTDAELVYAAYARCPCGAGMAYPKGIGGHGFWDCSAILTGRAYISGEVKHTDRLPFVFWKVKSEVQPSVNGATTRPK